MPLQFDSGMLSIVFSAAAMLLGSFLTYITARRKIRVEFEKKAAEQARDMVVRSEQIKIDEFSAIIKANEDFRAEIRLDLETAKREAVDAKKVIDELNSHIADYYSQIVKLKEEINNYKLQLLESSAEIQSLTHELTAYKDSVKNLRERLNSYEENRMQSGSVSQ